MLRRTPWIAALSICALATASARAESVTYIGTVTAVFDSSDLLSQDGSVAAGTTYTLTYNIDGLPDDQPADPNVANYFAVPFTATLGNYTFTGLGSALVLNDNFGFDSVQFHSDLDAVLSTGSFGGTPSSISGGFGHFGNGGETTNSIDGDDLFAAVQATWAQREFSISVYEGNLDERVRFTGQIMRVVIGDLPDPDPTPVIPTPAAAGLGIALLAAAGARRRR